jgi:hypothetical protein
MAMVLRLDDSSKTSDVVRYRCSADGTIHFGVQCGNEPLVLEVKKLGEACNDKTRTADLPGEARI